MGVVETTLLPGPYEISVNYSSPGDANASDFNNFFQTSRVFVDPFSQEVQNISISFSDEYLFSGHLSYPDGENVSVEYLLYNEDDDEWFSVQTDENGNFNTYVPSGDWLIIISPTDYDNKSYTLRQPIVIGR